MAVALAACALLYHSLVPLAALAMLVVLAALYCLSLIRWISRCWHRAGALALPWHPVLEKVVLINLAPPDMPPAAAAMVYPLSPSDRLHFVVAHEYVHHLARDHYRVAALPAWFDEGLAFWLGEELAGVAFWRPESRACLSEAEPPADPRQRFCDQSYRQTYMRLMARYYWEVKSLVEAGRVRDQVTTPPRELGRLRLADHTLQN